MHAKRVYDTCDVWAEMRSDCYEPYPLPYIQRHLAGLYLSYPPRGSRHGLSGVWCGSRGGLDLYVSHDPHRVFTAQKLKYIWLAEELTGRHEDRYILCLLRFSPPARLASACVTLVLVCGNPVPLRRLEKRTGASCEAHLCSLSCPEVKPLLDDVPTIHLCISYRWATCSIHHS
jgi:hypothetical protein